jgi:hypothetical protein
LNSDLHSVDGWLDQALEVLPEPHGVVLVFNAVTGLRPEEGCNSTRLIGELGETGSLGDYFNKKLSMLEHFRYRDLFLRGNKNAFISFVSERLLDRVVETKPDVSYAAMLHVLQRRRLNSRMKDLRHLYATQLREHVPREVVDLLQGRIGESVFLRYYYEPFLKPIKKTVLTVLHPFTERLMGALSQGGAKQ